MSKDKGGGVGGLDRGLRYSTRIVNTIPENINLLSKYRAGFLISYNLANFK